MDKYQLYLLLGSLHRMTVLFTVSGFLLRSWWMLRDSPLLASRLARTLPHVNDTLLLASALGTAAIIGQYPLHDAWLTAKVVATVLYILLGAVALHYGPTRSIRIGALLAALGVFGYIVAVALTKNPLPWS